jgi:hypothetical protein
MMAVYTAWIVLLAIVAGVIINRPAAPVAWLLFAAANLSFAIGQLSFLVITQVRHESLAFPSVVDAFYLVTYPIYAIGLLIFIRRRSTGHDRRSLVDALTVTVSLTMLSWLYLILPYVHNPALSWPQKAVSIAYPIGDVLVLAILARLLAPGGWRTRSLQLLTIGTFGLLASDVAFGLLQLYSSFRQGTAADLGWVLFYAAWGAAALHPSMTTLTEPNARPQPPSSAFRLVLVMLAALVPPVVLFVEFIDKHVIGAGIIAVCSALLYVLVLSRLAEVAAALRRALARAQVLRQAGAALDELKVLGVRLAIDDFGTGYSSLSYLRELPIDVLKIDKSFVDGITVSTQRLALAEVIVRIAKTLGLTVIAEGIESEVQRDMLVSMGCRYGQGYLLATPMPAAEAEALLRVGRGLVPQLPGSRRLMRAHLAPAC